MDTYIYRHVLLILVLYIGLFISFYGWGSITSRVLRLRLLSIDAHCFPVIWTGWSVVLLILQCIHLFFQMDWRVSATVYFLGGFYSLILIYKNLLKPGKNFEIRASIRLAIYILIVLVVAYWLAFKGMGPAKNYDSGLYHFNTIHWINSFKIVPGLGNLHGRLAFNQSFFVYAASLNFHPYFPYARSTANGFLFLLVFSEITWYLIKSPERDLSVKNISQAWNISYISYLCSLLFIVYLGLTSVDLASPSPDLACSLIQLVIFIWFIQIIINVRNHKLLSQLVPILFILAITSITVKLSNLVFSVSIISTSLFLIKSEKGEKTFDKTIIRVALLAGAMVLVWVVRGIYLSGYPLYPASFAGVQVDWAVPKEAVQDKANWVYSWARTPGQHPGEVLGNWEWVSPWFVRLHKYYENAVIWPTRLTAGFIIAAVALAFFNKKLSLLYRDAIFLVPTLISILYWFFSAPDPRFANALFFLILLSAILIFKNQLNDLTGSHASTVIIGITIATAMVLLLRANYPNIKSDFSEEYVLIKEAPLIEKRTNSGLTVYVPAKGDQCWDSPLPCTPYFNPALRLRTPLEIESGFTLKQ